MVNSEFCFTSELTKIDRQNGLTADHSHFNDFVAQWIEHGFSKPRVTGSSPVEVTKGG